MNNSEPATKPHYPILDGLRGVAAIIVVTFHLTEPLSTGRLDNLVNHGYLAVDFFFLLSGFVIGYAYDGRWHKMTVGNFLKRRIERLTNGGFGDDRRCYRILFYGFYAMAPHSYSSRLEDAVGDADRLYHPACTIVA